MSLDHASSVWSGDDVDGVDVEEVVARGLDVAVEDHVVGGVVDRPAAAEHGVRLGPRSVRVTYHHGPWRTGTDSSVSWTRDLISSNSVLDQVGVLVEERVGVGVLGLEVGDRVGVVAVAQPGPRVVDGAGRALPRVRLGRGDGRVGQGRRCRSWRDGTVSGPVPFVASMRVWIDQDLCTGDGLCVDHCPDVFTQLEDGIAYVTEAGRPLNDPGGSGSLARVPVRQRPAA